MTEFLNSNGGLIATILVVVVGLNLLLVGLHQFLGYIKDLTKNWQGDDKAYEAIGKVISVLQKIIEMLSASQSKKEDAKKLEEKK